MAEFGNCYNEFNTIDIPANLTTGDEVLLMSLPPGVTLTDFSIRNTDFDSGTTLSGTIGFRPLNPYPAKAENLTFFASTFTQFQSASSGYVPLVFDPIYFEDAMAIVFKAAAGGVGTGTIRTKALGRVVGVT
jgi:hypothetical protein